MITNSYFKLDDPKTTELAGFKLRSGWWSRPYEYAWAIGFAESGQTVADMGCGYTYRPFKDALAKICEFVYAVDVNDKLLKLPNKYPNLRYVIADFTKTIDKIPAGSLDRIFCVSVIEHLGLDISELLTQFANYLRPDGLMVITFESIFDHSRKSVRSGVEVDDFTRAVDQAGLCFIGGVNDDRSNAVNQPERNICAFHCVLEINA